MKNMYDISTQLINHLRYFESNGQTMGQYVTRLFKILDFALEQCEDDDEDTVKLKELLAEFTFEYICGRGDRSEGGEKKEYVPYWSESRGGIIRSRVSAFAITAYALDIENTKLTFSNTVKLLQKSQLTRKKAMIQNLTKLRGEWTDISTKMIENIDSKINGPADPAQLAPLDPEILQRLQDAGLPHCPVSNFDGTIQSEIKEFKEFQQYGQCKNKILVNI